MLVAVLDESVDLALGNGDIDRFGEPGQTRVLRVCGVEGAEVRGGDESLGEGVLAAAAADEEDVDFVCFGHAAMVGRGGDE